MFELHEGNETFFVYGGGVSNNYLYVALSKEVSVYDKLETLAGILGLVGFCSALLIFMVSYFFSRQALRPIDKLKAYIAEGKA